MMDVCVYVALNEKKKKANTPIVHSNASLSHTFQTCTQINTPQTISRAEKLGEDYTEGEVLVEVKVERGQIEEVRQQLQDATKGAGTVEELVDYNAEEDR